MIKLDTLIKLPQVSFGDRGGRELVGAGGVGAGAQGSLLRRDQGLQPQQMLAQVAGGMSGLKQKVSEYKKFIQYLFKQHKLL
jgi:hypothetical protein